MRARERIMCSRNIKLLHLAWDNFINKIERQRLSPKEEAEVYASCVLGINPWFRSSAFPVCVPKYTVYQIQNINNGIMRVQATEYGYDSMNSGSLLRDTSININPRYCNETIDLLIEVVGLAFIREINKLLRRMR